MMKKKILATIMTIVTAVMLFCGCAGEMSGITVITREKGSGTRSAFIEITGIEAKNEEGTKVDRTMAQAETQSSTAAVITSVSNTKNAVGYISLGSLNDTVKAVKVNGVEATVENVKNGTYKLSRPFNIAYKGELDQATQDFVNFIMSSNGQSIIEKEGYIKVKDDAAAYTSSNLSGTVKIAGSSSVSPVMGKLREAYIALNPNVTVDIQTSDSTTGMNEATEKPGTIGMASREIKQSEIDGGLTGLTIAKDGIAVIVNKENDCSDLTLEQITKIYIGESKEWSEVNG